ncbi:FecCD family ABC transporter permease [Paenibacillus sp. WLX2291]|uniref:FecCD family ABC transporter permease n=1 Tax=Paenibacillus sp. WLX2291 TaxID=3296934 RepID=UPI003983ECD4
MSRQAGLPLLLFVVLLVLSVILTAGIGSVHIPAGQITRILLYHVPWLHHWITPDWNEAAQQIMLKIRLPRVLLALLVGAALGVAGAAFQGVLRNPLADPFTLGVSSGSSVGAAVLIFTGYQYALFGNGTLPLVAFVTGSVTLYAVLALAREEGRIPTASLILAGVVMQSFLGAIVSFLASMSEGSVNEIIFWTMGSLSLRGWSYVTVMLPYVLIGILFLWSQSRAMNILALGEKEAAHLGLAVDRTKLIVLIVATLVTAAAVSVSGVIAFVGLVVPHMIRLLFGSDYRLLIPMSALGGGIFLIWADTVARTVLAPTEIPLGVVTAFVGAPFFAYLLHRNKKQRNMI